MHGHGGGGFAALDAMAGSSTEAVTHANDGVELPGIPKEIFVTSAVVALDFYKKIQCYPVPMTRFIA